MKKFLTVMLTLVVALQLSAQTSLPSAWSFATTSFPFGWTAQGNTYYTGSGNTPPACKFDNTGDWLEIYFSGSAGPVSYYITGNSFSGGTFEVQESVNGTVWTVLHTWNSSNLPSSTYSQFTDQPAAASRYVRFYYTNKVSGNVGVDDVNIAAPPAGPQQEINVQQTSNTIVTGGTAYVQSPVSTNTPFTLDIQNQGTANTLNISSITITGPDAGDFNIASPPTTVAANSSAPLVVDFTPSVVGTRNAVITINNDDADEPAYVINIYGVGGSFATEPTAQPTNFQFTGVRSYRFVGSFTAASPQPEGYIVLRNDAGPVTDIPVDGNAYMRGDQIGASKVVFSGNLTSFAPLNIGANSTYHFAVFSYNGPAQFRNYLTPNPLTGNVTSSGSMQPGNFYNGISTGSASFVNDLTTLINPHTDNFYSNYGPRMVTLFWARDTTGDQRVVDCVYSGEALVYTEPFAWNTFSREHTYAFSWMPSNPNSNTPEYSDYFNLFPTNLNDANVIRSNYPLGEVVNVTYTYLGCKFGTNAIGQGVFEPREEQKGDAARALFYMATSYNSQSANWGFPNPISSSVQYGQDQDLLKAWSYMDPPDAREIARNDFIDSLQGNRNPFIDSIQYACYIDFTNMTHISGPTVPCGTIGVKENLLYKAEMSMWPNPNTGNGTLYYKTERNENITITVRDLTGRDVYTHKTNAQAGNNAYVLELHTLAKGTYSISVNSGVQVITSKLVIQ